MSYTPWRGFEPPSALTGENPRSAYRRRLRAPAAVLAGTALLGVVALNAQYGLVADGRRPGDPSVAPAGSGVPGVPGVPGAPGSELSVLGGAEQDKCLSVVKLREELRPLLADCGSRSAQTWSADEDRAGPLRLRNRAANVCLTFPPASASPAPAPGPVAPAPLLRVCREGDGSQAFHLISFGELGDAAERERRVRVVQDASGRALEVSADGTSLIQGTGDANPDQVWLIRLTART